MMRYLAELSGVVRVLAISLLLTAYAIAASPPDTGQPESAGAVPSSVGVGTSGPPDIEVLAAGSANGLLGRKVEGSRGENMGLVVDVLVGEDGTPLAAVIDFGGFLGVGSRKIAVAWSSIHFQTSKPGAPLVLDFSRAQVQSAPAYKETKGTLQILASPTAARPDAR